jgi:hypothetical protein
MNLKDEDGLRAFLRGATNFCMSFGSQGEDSRKTIQNIRFPLLGESSSSKEEDNRKTIESLGKPHQNIMSRVAAQAQSLWEQASVYQFPITTDDEFEITRVTVNPMIMFLLTDQGVYNNEPLYTPFATPKANGRSLLEEHVDTVCEAMDKNDYTILSKEDFSISPYQIVMGEWNNPDPDPKNQLMEEECQLQHEEEDVLHAEWPPKGQLEEHPIPYKSVLDRDQYCHRSLMSKRAERLSALCLKEQYEVSSLIGGIRHDPTKLTD